MVDEAASGVDGCADADGRCMIRDREVSEFMLAHALGLTRRFSDLKCCLSWKLCVDQDATVSHLLQEHHETRSRPPPLFPPF